MGSRRFDRAMLVVAIVKLPRRHRLSCHGTASLALHQTLTTVHREFSGRSAGAARCHLLIRCIVRSPPLTFSHFFWASRRTGRFVLGLSRPVPRRGGRDTQSGKRPTPAELALVGGGQPPSTSHPFSPSLSENRPSAIVLRARLRCCLLLLEIAVYRYRSSLPSCAPD